MYRVHRRRGRSLARVSGPARGPRRSAICARSWPLQGGAGLRFHTIQLAAEPGTPRPTSISKQALKGMAFAGGGSSSALTRWGAGLQGAGAARAAHAAAGQAAGRGQPQRQARPHGLSPGLGQADGLSDAEERERYPVVTASLALAQTPTPTMMASPTCGDAHRAPHHPDAPARARDYDPGGPPISTGSPTAMRRCSEPPRPWWTPMATGCRISSS